ncbi:hypothetical protein VEE59_22110 [Escherichia coli]|nr:hypothetical protein VEE59_22110 [Escherichia coli]
MLPSETMIWQPEFTDKTLSRKPGAVHLTGAGRLSESMASNTKPVSPYLILTQLLTHDTLTVSAVQESLSRKRTALGEPMVSTRYARYVYSTVVSASKSVQYHASKAGS